MTRINEAAEPEDIAEVMGNLATVCRENLLLAQAEYTDTANQSQHRSPAPKYEIGDWAWLNTKNIRTRRPCRKLDDRWIGPYRVTQVIKGTACRLALPQTLKIHPVFHVNLLRHGLPEHGARPAPVIGDNPDDEEPEWEVEKILDWQPARGRRPKRFLVHWKGYPLNEATWEPEVNIAHAQDAVRDFWSSQELAPSGG